jgi:hypothetical protein
MGSPRVARGAGTALPQARGRVRWPKQPRPGVRPGICRRGPRGSEGSGPSRSAHVMSPAATRGYEWQTRPWRQQERGVCKLPKRSFRAARRPQTAPCVDGREEVSRTGTDHRGAVCGETRTHGVRRAARQHIPGSTGKHSKEVFGLPAYPRSKGQRDQSMLGERRGCRKTLYGRPRSTRSIW